MRFAVELKLENEIFPKDKNRVILSFLKRNYENYNKDYFNSLYKNEINKQKDFTFSLYMGNCKFLRDTIEIPDKKIVLNFSTYNPTDGIHFYNSILENKNNNFKIKDNEIKINNIRMIKEKPIREEVIRVKSMSPIVAKNHKGDNKTTWYYSLSEEEGMKQLINNIENNLIRVFGEEVRYDLKDLKINLLKDNKEVKVKNFDIEVLGNLVYLEIKAKTYILDYLYKAGIGSVKSSGFGMIDFI